MKSKPVTIAAMAVAALVITLIATTTRSAPPQPGPPSEARDDDTVRYTKIGHPIWKPVDAHIFSAPVGTAASGYAEFLTTLLSILPPPKHVFHPDLGGPGPGAPHAPPYNHEMDEGVENAGYADRHVFRHSDFSNGAGVFLAFMAIPSPGTTGSSPDFASGRIIPNSICPIHSVAFDYHNGQQFSNVADFNVPPLDASLNPPFFVDGHSHIPLFLADNADFGPPGANLNGEYLYYNTLTDATGNGWIVEARFTIRR